MRHEIVHNRYVVEGLKAKGAVFVEELDEIPETDAPVIFSAHGVPKSVPAEAQKRNFFALDATCPLVTKVHREAEIHHKRGREIVLIGHAGHPEVVGTMGQLPAGAVTLVETVEEARAFTPRDPGNLAYVTQTTLSVDDTAEIVAALKARFPQIVGPHKEDICYATTNRQEAVKKVAPHGRGDDGGRGAELLQLPAPARGGRARRLPARGAGAARRGHRLVGVRLDREPRRHRRRLGAGGAGRGDDRRLRRALRGDRRDRRHRRGGRVLPAAAAYCGRTEAAE